MASMPELGSKISLISKSDIRYEGQLYTVDPNECTIALANGKFYVYYFYCSFGFVRLQKIFFFFFGNLFVRNNLCKSIEMQFDF